MTINTFPAINTAVLAQPPRRSAPTAMSTPSDYWKSLRAQRAAAASSATPHLRLTAAPARPESVQALLHRWIPSPPQFPDLDAFASRVSKMPPSRPADMRVPKRRRIGVSAFIPIGGCWIFHGSPDHEYPLFRVPSTGSWEAAYTWLYEKLHGLAPVDDPPSDVDHKCENKRCVNPDHLERVSHPENVRRSRPKTLEIGEKDR